MVELLPNKTLFFQIGIFLFTYISLKYLVFKPTLRLIDRRKALTIGAEAEAQALNEKTQALIEAHQKKLSEARQQGLSLRDKSKKEGETEAQSMLAETQKELESSLEKARQGISQQSKEAQLVLRQLSRTLSSGVVEKLLGRKVAS